MNKKRIIAIAAIAVAILVLIIIFHVGDAIAVNAREHLSRIGL